MKNFVYCLSYREQFTFKLHFFVRVWKKKNQNLKLTTKQQQQQKLTTTKIKQKKKGQI